MTSLFNLESYYLRLQTKRLGRPCLYLDKVGSTIDVAENEKYDTLVLAKVQTNGRGQRTNKWLSPPGCAMASHIIAMSAALTLERIDPVRLGRNQIALKWPNDIIYKRNFSKIGGILVKTKDQLDHHDITLSFGLNVLNREPTTCIDEILSSERLGEKPMISIDSVVADIMNVLESYTYELTDEKFEQIKAEYESRCLQMNKVVLDAEHGTVLVKGVNDEGYLIGENSMTGKTQTITKII